MEVRAVSDISKKVHSDYFPVTDLSFKGDGFTMDVTDDSRLVVHTNDGLFVSSIKAF